MNRLVAAVTVTLIAGLFHMGCGDKGMKDAEARLDPEHEQQIRAWQAERRAGLTADDGWLSVVGLSWLSPGENRVGSDPLSDVELPPGKAPAYVGSMFLENGSVRFLPARDAGILIDGKPAGETLLRSDVDDDTTVMTFGSLTFFVIKRADRVGVRVKDSQSEAIRSFKELEYFPVHPQFRVEAKFEPYDPPKIIPIANVIGITEEQSSPGAFVFQIDGTTHRIDPILEVGGSELFVIFADQTNGKETYGAGRYIYTAMPEDGKVILDFNEAYNPPCVFTAYATCPLPPPQNRLPIRVEAGEKNYEGSVALAN